MPTSKIGQRLKMEMNRLGINSVDLARRAGVKTSFIYDVINGKSNNPSTVTLAHVADALGVDLTTLVRGHEDSLLAEGGMRTLLKARHDHTERDPENAAIAGLTIDLSSGARSVVTIHDGHDCPVQHFSRSWLQDHLQATPSQLRLLRVHDDSMEPTLKVRDLVLIDLAKKEPTPPGLFVVFDGVGLVARRLELVPSGASGTVRIIADQAQYASYERAPDQVHIIGRIVWCAREL